MGFDLREHTADIAVEATAPTLDAVFGDVADGLAAAMCEDIPDDGDVLSVKVTAESRTAALFEYLDELILQRDLQSVLPVDNTATVYEQAGVWTVDGRARGVPLAAIAGREIKAVTYSEMELRPTADGWYAYVVFDM